MTAMRLWLAPGSGSVLPEGNDDVVAEGLELALGKQGAAVAQRKRTGGDSPKTRAELYEIAKQRDLPGRSKMGRDELARKLGEK